MNKGTLPIKQIIPTRDRKLVSDTLSLDRVWASEALKHLDDALWPLSSWYVYSDGNHLGLILLNASSVFLMGDPRCLAQMMDAPWLPKKIFVESPTSCVGILKSLYDFDSALVMHKMALKHFRANTFTIHPEVRPLRASDFPQARDLYVRNMGGHFTLDQFQNNFYFGTEQNGNLVSMSGTASLCPDYCTATIGSVVTDAAHRNKGYATSELVLLCQQLLTDNYHCITIKVNRGNVSATALYRRIGFIKSCDYFEGVGHWKEKKMETSLRKEQ
jgi:predicted GNAT family N-acyltransferase